MRGRGCVILRGALLGSIIIVPSIITDPTTPFVLHPTERAERAAAAGGSVGTRPAGRNDADWNPRDDSIWLRRSEFLTFNALISMPTVIRTGGVEDGRSNHASRTPNNMLHTKTRCIQHEAFCACPLPSTSKGRTMGAVHVTQFPLCTHPQPCQVLGTRNDGIVIVQLRTSQNKPYLGYFHLTVGVHKYLHRTRAITTSGLVWSAHTRTRTPQKPHHTTKTASPPADQRRPPRQ